MIVLYVCKRKNNNVFKQNAIMNFIYNVLNNGQKFNKLVHIVDNSYDIICEYYNYLRISWFVR